MKKTLLTFSIFASISILGFSQPTLEWEKSIGGTANDNANSIKRTTDGGSIVAGFSLSTDVDITDPNGLEDYWVAKLSSLGAIEWQKSYGGTGIDVPTCVLPTTDGGYIIGGYSNSTDGDITTAHGDYDIWVVKITNDGTISWQKSLGGTNVEYCSNIIEISGGNFLVAGRSGSNDGDVTGGHGGVDAWLIELTSLGTITWQKTYGGSDEDGALLVKKTVDGNYFFSGYSNSNDGDLTANQGSYDYWAVKVNSTGTILWQKTVGGTGEDIAYVMDETSSGQFILSGSSESTNGDVTNNKGGIDYWVVKLSATGALLAQASFGGDNADEARALKITQDGSIIISGRTGTFNNGDVSGQNGNWDFWIVKLSASLTLHWQLCLGGTDADYANTMSISNDGGEILVAGMADSNDGDVSTSIGLNDFWIVKLTDPGVSINENELEEVNVFPNPATNQLTISADNVSFDEINVYNTLGQNVTALTKEINNNQNKLIIDITALNAGVYYLKTNSVSTIIYKQ